jgi:hypothetical protein
MNGNYYGAIEVTLITATGVAGSQVSEVSPGVYDLNSQNDGNLFLEAAFYRKSDNTFYYDAACTQPLEDRQGHASNFRNISTIPTGAVVDSQTWTLRAAGNPVALTQDGAVQPSASNLSYRILPAPALISTRPRSQRSAMSRWRLTGSATTVPMTAQSSRPRSTTLNSESIWPIACSGLAARGHRLFQPRHLCRPLPVPVAGRGCRCRRQFDHSDQLFQRTALYLYSNRHRGRPWVHLPVPAERRAQPDRHGSGWCGDPFRPVFPLCLPGGQGVRTG